MTSSAQALNPRKKSIVRGGLAAALALLSTAFFASVGIVSPALAHDEITNTSPADGSSVEAGQFEVSITSSGEITNLDEMSTNDVTVVGPLDDPNSGVVSAPCIRVLGNVASTPV